MKMRERKTLCPDLYRWQNLTPVCLVPLLKSVNISGPNKFLSCLISSYLFFPIPFLVSHWVAIGAKQITCREYIWGFLHLLWDERLVCTVNSESRGMAMTGWSKQSGKRCVQATASPVYNRQCQLSNGATIYLGTSWICFSWLLSPSADIFLAW